jgi:hypothetical protein
MEFNNETVQGVWEKARATNDEDPNEWREDECGAWIKYDQYGHQTSDFGWKIESVTALFNTKIPLFWPQVNRAAWLRLIAKVCHQPQASTRPAINRLANQHRFRPR